VEARPPFLCVAFLSVVKRARNGLEGSGEKSTKFTSELFSGYWRGSLNASATSTIISRGLGTLWSCQRIFPTANDVRHPLLSYNGSKQARRWSRLKILFRLEDTSVV
jgi:hypothetical protein